jgi:serine/threonine-protein kinase
VLGAGAYFAQQRQNATVVAETGSPVVAPTLQSPPPPGAPARVSITLRASPAQARLFLDGEALPANPTTRLFPADGKTHVLRAEAPGFSDASTEFEPTRDTALELTLAPLARVSEPSGTSPRRVVRGGRPAAPVTKPTASVAAPSPKPDCDSPFFLDKDGIRRVRPECR